MRIPFLALFMLTALRSAFCSPYWVITEDEPFLKDKSGFSQFTISYYSIETRFGNEEKTLVAKKQFKLDKTANILEMKQDNYDDNSHLRIGYLYDKSGRLLEERVLGQGNLYIATDSYEYAGNTIVHKYYTAGLISQQKQVTDDQGRLIEDTLFSSDGKIMHSNRYVYEEGKKTWNMYDSDGKLLMRDITYYTEDGKVAKEEEYDSDKLSRTFFYSYLPTGEEASREVLDSDGSVVGQEVHEYEANHLVSTVRTSVGKPERKEVFEYDIQGRLRSLKAMVKVDKFGEQYYESEYLIERTTTQSRLQFDE